MTSSEWQDKNNQLIERALDLVQLNYPSVIHTFFSKKENNEPDTALFINRMKEIAPEVQFVFPRVVEGTSLMKHYLYEEKTLFVTNKWGIAEPDPQTSTEIFPEQIDLVLIPMLVFDNQGYRVGYGGGYYDRFLAQCRSDVIKVGLSFFGPIDCIEDTDTYDIPLNFCITPDNIWEW